MSHIVCADAYLVPAEQGQHLLGASFDPTLDSPALSAQSQLDNINKLNRCLSEPLATDVPLRGRVSFRCTAGDYLPLVGPVPRILYHQKHYANLHLGKASQYYAAAHDYPGLFISAAHGARGLTGALLAAEVLVAMISGHPMPIEQSTLNAIHPARFWIRRFKRNQPI